MHRVAARRRTHATHLVVLGAVAEDQAHVRDKVLGAAVLLGAAHLQLLLHLLQVHGLLDDLVVVGHLGGWRRRRLASLFLVSHLAGLFSPVLL